MTRRSADTRRRCGAMPSEKSRSLTSGRSVFGKKSKRWKPLLQASQKASERSGRLEAMEAEKRSLEARLKALEGELATSKARLRTATAEQKALSEGCRAGVFQGLQRRPRDPRCVMGPRGEADPIGHGVWGACPPSLTIPNGCRCEPFWGRLAVRLGKTHCPASPCP